MNTYLCRALPALSIYVPAASLLFFWAITAESATGGDRGERDYTIHLKAKQFVPKKGITAEALGKFLSSNLPRVHGIIQFSKPVEEADEATLAELDVHLLKGQYVPNLAFYASLPPTNALAVAELPFVRTVMNVEPWYKTEPRILDGDISAFSRLPGDRLFLRVEFYADVSSAEALQILSERAGVIVEAPIGDGGKALVEVPQDEFVELLGEDGVEWAVDLVEPLFYMDEARPRIGADVAQAAPFNLDGTGVKIGIWDENTISVPHLDMTGRVFNGDGTPGNSAHAMNVAGIAVGDGFLQPKYTGIAPDATAVTYDWNNYWAEHDSAIAPFSHNISVENNSWSGPSATAKQVDQIVTGFWHGRRITSVWAFGNSGPGRGTAATSGQRSKNSIAVGGTNASDDANWRGASRGPLSDGRLKPDIAAPACNDIGDFVFIPASQSLDTTDAITMEVWMKPEDPGLTNPRPLLHYSAPGVINNGPSMMQWFSFRPFTFFATSRSGNAFDGVQSVPPSPQNPRGFEFQAGRWYHAVATYDGAAGERRLYIDGKEVVTATVPGSQLHLTPLKTFLDLYVGGSGFALNNKYNGFLDAVRIYNRALTEDEVESRFRFPRRAVPGPVLRLDFEQHRQIVRDTSGNANHGFLGFTPERVPGLDSNDPIRRTGPSFCDWPGARSSESCLEFRKERGDPITTTGLNNQYGGGCGTSAAAPAVTGSVALLLEYWDTLSYFPDPWPSTVKGILLNTAQDIHQTGPDFNVGHGRLNIAAAVRYLRRDNGTRDRIIESSTVDDAVHEFQFDIHSTSCRMAAMLVWDDPAATSSVSKALVNDLDLVLVDPTGKKHLPYVLDPDRPARPAQRGKDSINNVEQVEPPDVVVGAWTARVIGFFLPNASSPQRYSLILPYCDGGVGDPGGPGPT